MKSHKFDVEDAEKHGVKKAILLEHIRFHMENNRGIQEYTIDGKTWCHARRKTLKKMYPYMNARSISRWLKELEEEGVIESCKPRINGGNHTKYYRLLNASEGNGQNDQSNGQNDHSACDNKVSSNGQNDHSSIYHLCEETMCKSAGAREGSEKDDKKSPDSELSIDKRIKQADSPKALAEVWFEYLRQRNQFPTLFQQESNVNKIDQWGPVKAKKIVSIAIDRGYKSLRESYLEGEDEATAEAFDTTGIANAGAYKEYEG